MLMGVAYDALACGGRGGDPLHVGDLRVCVGAGGSGRAVKLDAKPLRILPARVISLVDEYGDLQRCVGCKGQRVVICQRFSDGTRWTRVRYIHDVSCVARYSEPETERICS